MKKIFTLFLAGLLLIGIVACGSSGDSSESAGGHTPVSSEPAATPTQSEPAKETGVQSQQNTSQPAVITVMTKSTAYLADGSLDAWQEYFYDEQGEKRRETVYGADGTLQRSEDYGEGSYGSATYHKEEICDEHGNITEYRVYDSSGALRSQQLFEYEYDGNDRMTKKTELGTGGSVLYWHEYEYDASGTKRKDIRHTSDGSISRIREYNASGELTKDTSYKDGVTDSWDDYEYDGTGNLIQKMTTTAQFGVGITCTFEYDEANRLIRYAEVYDGGSIYQKNDYDSDGNLIRTENYMNDNLLGWTEYEYGIIDLENPEKSTAPILDETDFSTDKMVIVSPEQATGVIVLKADRVMGSDVKIYEIYSFDVASGYQQYLAGFQGIPIETSQLVRNAYRYLPPGYESSSGSVTDLPPETEVGYRHWFSEDYCLFASTQMDTDSGDMHAGWFDETGYYFDVTDGLWLSSWDDEPMQYIAVGFYKDRFVWYSYPKNRSGKRTYYSVQVSDAMPTGEKTEGNPFSSGEPVTQYATSDWIEQWIHDNGPAVIIDYK